jgi:hypothetical protein
MAEPAAFHIRLVRIIDKFTDTTGTWVAWLNVPLVLVVAYEVFARYLFDAPTIWSFDITYMLYGTIFMLGSAYALHKGAHIRTDFFFEKWSIRTKGMIDSGQRAGGLVRDADRRDLGADAVAADPVAVQAGGAADLSAAADPGHLGDHQVHLRRALGH